MGTNLLPWLGNPPFPFQGAMVSKSANQSLNTATNTTITFNTVAFDTGSFFSDADDAFVAPSAGWMQVWGGGRWESIAGTYRRIRPMKDGAIYPGGGGEGFLAPASASRCCQSFMTMPVEVAGGEKFTMQGLHARGSALNMLTNDQTYFGCRFIPQMQGTLLGLTANESIADDTLTYVPWDSSPTGGFDHLGAWASGDPTKLTLPHWLEDEVWIYAGLHFASMSGDILLDIDRDTGSRSGGTVLGARTTATGAHDSYATVASGLFKPRYDGSEQSSEYAGFDSIPNDYKMQVLQSAGAARNLIADGQSYLAAEVVPGMRATRIRLAANRTIANQTFTTVNWGNKVERDDYGMFNPASPTKLITPPGFNYARLVANLTWDDGGINDRFIQFMKGGVNFLGGGGKMVQAPSGAGHEPRNHIATIVPISSAGGEEFEAQAWQNHGSDQDLLAGNTPIFEISLWV